MSPTILGFSVYENSIQQEVEYSNQFHFNHLEINLYPKHLQLYTFTNEKISLYNKLALESNINFSFHPPFSINIAHEFDYIRAKNIQFLVNCLEIGHKLHLRHITLHLGSFIGHTSMKSFRQKALMNCIKSLKELLYYSQKYNITIAIENAVKMHSGSEIEHLGDNIDDFNIIFDNINSPLLKICFDIGHAHIGNNSMSYIQNLGHKFSCIHLHDNNGEYDEHQTIGNGTVNWSKVTDALKSLPFNGPFIFECHNEKPHISSNQFLKYWNENQIY